MEVNNETIQVLVDDNGAVDVQFAGDWRITNSMWRIGVLSNLIATLTGHLDDTAREWKMLLDMSKEFGDDIDE